MTDNLSGSADPDAITLEGENGENVETRMDSQAPDKAQGQADSASAEGSVESPEQEKARTKKRMDELLAQRYEAEQKAQQAAQQAEALKRQLDQATNQSWQQQHQAQKPTYQDYETPEQYEQALNQWLQAGYQKQFQAQQKHARMMQIQQEQIGKNARIMQKVAQSAAKYPDFNEVVQNPNVPSLAQLSPAAYEVLIDSEQMADISYYLAKNPQELFNFKSLSPVQAVREIFKLETRFSNPGRTPSAPPNPPSTLKGAGTVQPDPSKMTIDEWMKWRNKQLAEAK